MNKKDVVEILYIYKKDGSVLREIDVTGWTWKRKWQHIQLSISQLMLSDHWNIVTKKKTNDKNTSN